MFTPLHCGMKHVGSSRRQHTPQKENACMDETLRATAQLRSIATVVWNELHHGIMLEHVRTCKRTLQLVKALSNDKEEEQ